MSLTNCSWKFILECGSFKQIVPRNVTIFKERLPENNRPRNIFRGSLKWTTHEIGEFRCSRLKWTTLGNTTTTESTFTIPLLSVSLEPTVISLHCRFLAWKSENNWGPKKPTVKVHITTSWWLPTVICHCWFVAWTGSAVVLSLLAFGGSDSSIVEKPMSSSLLPPSRAHLAERCLSPPLPALLHSPNCSMEVLDFQAWAWSSCFKVSNKHLLLWICSFTIVLMARLFDSHASYFSILESTF
jgi:hypothetical protein